MSDTPLLHTCVECGTTLDVSDESPMSLVSCPACNKSQRVLTTFNNFMLEEVLGAGGMGAVYKALDVHLQRHVALKLLRKEHNANEEFITKFETEARITASITHPYVVKVFSFGEDHGLYYIAMELVDKGSLDDLMSLQGKVAEAQALEVGQQIAQGLQAAFQAGLIHRDVKPGNILFAGPHLAKIVDFGLALLMEQEAEARGEIWGTPYYVAPEKLDNQPEDFRSDIYSLGATLFHAIAGRPPFEADNASLVALKHLKSRAVSLQAFAPDVSNPTAFVINRMLEKDPEQRYQSYDELIEHLGYARSQLLEAAARPREKVRVVVEGQTQQRLGTWLTLATLVLILVIAGGLYFTRDRWLAAAGAPVTTPTVAAAESARERYERARRQVLDNEIESALSTFRELGDSADTPQPLRNWNTLHQGLALLLTDRWEEARVTFEELLKRGMFSDEQRNIALASFFMDTGRTVSAGAPLPGPAMRTYDPNNVEAMSLLLFGLKDWQFEYFEDSAQFLEAFMKAAPVAPYEWIAEYKPLAEPYLAALRPFLPVAEKIRTAQSPADAKAALAAVEAYRRDHRPSGKLAEYLTKVESELKAKAAM
jgi:tRNA A-37 threonylcarbamoyl transferase component Bud32